jgi:vancomycin resistance protein VanW
MANDSPLDRFKQALTGTARAIARQPEIEVAWTADAPVTTTYQVYESDHLMANAGPGVFVRHNVVKRRTFSPEGVPVADELVAVNEARMMYQPFLEAERS